MAHDPDDKNAAFTANLEMAANSNGTEEILALGEGTTFRATQVTVTTVEDPSGDVLWSVFQGDERLAPHDEDYEQATDTASVAMGKVLDVGDTAELRWTNNNASAVNATVTVEGVLTDQS